MHKEFEVNRLTKEGLAVMDQIAILFDNLLTAIENIGSEDRNGMSIVSHKLQEACFFAKKTLARKYNIEAE